jgi:hypothetical protein
MDFKYQKLPENGIDMPSVSTVDCSDPSAAGSSRERKKARRVVAVLVLGALLVSAAMLAVYFRVCSRLFDSEDLKYNFAVKGSSSVMQEVFSSVKDNYVQYYIEPSPTQRYWILDDFNTNLEIMRSEENDQSICFVSELNRKEAMAPTAVQPKYVPYKEHSHGIYTPDESPVEDKEFLGLTGRRLCRGTNVYWIRPMEDVIEVSELNTTISGGILEQGGNGGHRAKRNIRSCTTSCCWTVCCCDTHHFTFETAEHFTCMHVCNHCTKAYKQKIYKNC